MGRTVLVIIVLAGLGMPTEARQKPVRTATLHVENRNIYHTLEEFWKYAELIVEGRIVGGHAIDITASNGSVSTFTDFDIQVTEVFKNDGFVTETRTIEMRRPGGDRDRGDHIERLTPDDYPLFTEGETYIFFLKRHRVPAHEFYSTGVLASDGVVKITGAAVEALGRNPVPQNLKALGAAGARQLLRERRGR